MNGSSMRKLIELKQQQITGQKEQVKNQKKQMENQKDQMGNQERRFLKQLERQESLYKAQMKALLWAVHKTNTVASTSFQGTTPSFAQFNRSSEHWTNYWARFFVSVHSVSNNQKAQIFLTNQALTTYRLLSNLASQETPPKSINELDWDRDQYETPAVRPQAVCWTETFQVLEWDATQTGWVGFGISSTYSASCR